MKTAFQTHKNVKDVPGLDCKGCIRFYTAKVAWRSSNLYGQHLNHQIPRRSLPQHLIAHFRPEQRPSQRRAPIDQAMGGIRLVFSDQLHALLMIVFIGKGHPVADLHFVGRGGLCDHLGALQALLEVAPVAIEVGLALLIGQLDRKSVV